MRLNINRYQEIMKQQNIEKEDIERMTGITKQTLDWIWKNEYLEVSTLERLADVVSCSMQEIALQDHNNSENVIEWTRDGKVATSSLTQGRYISRIKKLAESNPEECRIVAENNDGSICAHVPVCWIRINPGMNLTDEQREKRAEAMRRNIFGTDNIRCETGLKSI